MAKKVEKITEELYVTLRAQPIMEPSPEKGWVVTGYEPPLGFAHPHNPGTKDDIKKKKTQLNWAYGRVEQLPPTESGMAYRYRSVREHYVDSEGFVHIKGSDRETVYPKAGRTDRAEIINHPDFDELVPQHLQPRIIKNEPTYGFQIQRSVSRYSTSNKVWRVLDPRGFELEITTGNFEDIVMGGTIHEGVIEGKCQWHGKKLVMVSV